MFKVTGKVDTGDNTPTEVTPGMIAASFNKFGAVDAHEYDWAGPNGKFKFTYKDVNGRFHDIMLDYPAILEESAVIITDPKELTKLESFQFFVRLYRTINEIYGVSQSDFDKWTDAVAMEVWAMPSTLATALNNWLEELATETSPKEGNIILHQVNDKFVPYTWSYLKYIKGQATHVDDKGHAYTLNKKGWVNRAIPLVDDSITLLDKEPHVTPNGKVTVTACEPFDALVEVWAERFPVKDQTFTKTRFEPFSTAESTVQVIDTVNYKGEPINVPLVSRIENEKEFFYLLEGFKGEIPTVVEETPEVESEDVPTSNE